MADTLLFSDAVSNIYRDASKALSEVEFDKKLIVKKNLVQIMQQSFFHGASRFGTNFIA